jgi:hypothetical protein
MAEGGVAGYPALHAMLKKKLQQLFHKTETKERFF